MKYDRDLEGEDEAIKTQKRVIVTRAETVPVTIQPITDQILSGAVAILGAELSRMAHRSNTTGLTDKEIKLLGSLVDSLAKVSREERQRIATDVEAIEQLSDEDLKRLAAEALED